jgi:hypothetical protein
MSKALAVFGTRHYTDQSLPPEIRAAMELILDEHSPTIGLEEWSVTRLAPSGFKTVCETKGIPWTDIGTPATSEFTTHDVTWALDHLDGANIRQYGPLDIHEKREHSMRAKIIDAMSSHESAVLVIGVAHLHSMCMKLKCDFEIRAWAFAPEFF